MKANTSDARLTSLRTLHDVTLSELAKYKLLVENIEDYAIFMMDSGGCIATWNKGATKIKGYAADEIIGRHFSAFYTQKDIDAHKPERELELATRYGRVEDEDWRVRKDGSTFWANVVITALYDADGKLVGFAKVTRDLTDRKQHEDSLRQANSVLRHQQYELEALNISKDEFVSLASHQLRTPATGIKQLLGLMLEGFSGPLTAEHRDFIAKAYESNERQLAIVNSLLKVAQVDAGKVILKKAPIDIRTLLDTIAEDYADTFRERAQTVSEGVSDMVAKDIFVDEKHFRMAIENIVDNASKYTPAGGHITIFAGMAHDLLCIAISDTGVGIDPKDIDKIFERFSRVANGLASGVSGTGLGLYWANKIIALHGGHIEVDSVPGHGTTFTVLIPAEASDA